MFMVFLYKKSDFLKNFHWASVQVVLQKDTKIEIFIIYRLTLLLYLKKKKHWVVRRGICMIQMCVLVWVGVGVDGL